MASFRKVALVLLLATVVAVMATAIAQFADYTHSEVLPGNGVPERDQDQQSQILAARMKILTGRVADVELLVLVLLATSGLYALVLVASSYLSSRSFARLADRTIANMKDEIGIAMADMRAVQEGGAHRIGFKPGTRSGSAAPVSMQMEPTAVVTDAWQSRLSNMLERTAQWRDRQLGEHERLELFRYETEAAYMEVAGGQRLAFSVANLYCNFAAIHNSEDPVRARFYLDRALVLAFAEPQLASEIRYQLACWFARAGDFEQAMNSLTAAFQQASTALDARLATDLEEGGRLYQMASTPPFDRRLNDLLLNVRIP